jgi:hypothetical protein
MAFGKRLSYLHLVPCGRWRAGVSCMLPVWGADTYLAMDLQSMSVLETSETMFQSASSFEESQFTWRDKGQADAATSSAGAPEGRGRTWGGSTKEPRGNGRRMKTVYVGSGYGDAIVLSCLGPRGTCSLADVKHEVWGSWSAGARPLAIRRLRRRWGDGELYRALSGGISATQGS